MLLPLISALMIAARDVLTRKLDSNLHSLYVVFASLILVTLVSGVISIFDWKPLLASNLLWLVVSSILLSAGFFIQIKAIRMGELSFIAPFLYMSILVAVFWGYVIWQDLPTIKMITGIVLIMISGVYMMTRRSHADS